MTRVVAGAAGGRRLRTPPGERTRPTTERAREAMFSSLGSERDLQGIRFLDLYAGSGAVGLEALSRGAAEVVLVEQDARACDVARANVRAVGLPGATVVRAPVLRHLARPTAVPWDVVFADPPYDGTDEEVTAVLAALAEPGLLTDDATIVVERRKRSADLVWPAGLEAGRERRYGEAVLCYGRRHA